MEIEINKLVEKYADLSVNEKEMIIGINDIVNILKSKKIAIYGAGSLGNIFLKLLNRYNVSIECFIDRSADKIKNVEDIPVFMPNYLCSLKEDNYIVIVAINTKDLSETIVNNINKMNSEISIINGFELSRILRYKECLQKHKNNEEFDIVECAKCGFEERGCPFCFSFINKISHSKKHQIKGSKKFDWLGYIMGQYCTLKCKHCCEGVPYLSNPTFTPAETIISDLKKVANACQFLKYVELIGGEPFLHPEFEKILEELLKIENIGYIKIFTNGTVVPNDSLGKVLKNPRIVIHLSNYLDSVSGDLKNNILKTREELNKKNINYIFIQSTNWLDFSSFKIRNVSNNVLEEAFSKCFLSNCHRLHNGILYRCPHQYAGAQKGELSLKTGEYIDINKLDTESLTEALEYFENLKFTDACRHCNMPFDAPEIPTGQQLP